jgi:hypothetical protein
VTITQFFRLVKFILALVMFSGWFCTVVYLFLKTVASQHHITFAIMGISTLSLPLILALGDDKW